MSQHEIYLDNAATTQPTPEVVEAVSRTFTHNWGNPSSEHARGRDAKDVLERSRAIIAECLGVDADEIYFTSGATEANNLAIRGACKARKDNAGSIVTSTLEHPSVTRTIRGMRRVGWDTVHIECPGGDFDLAGLERELSRDVTIVSVMAVQNELGYRMPIEDVARMTKDACEDTLVHVDAVQAFGKLPIAPREVGADLMSVTAHKIGGPKGIGALYVKRGTLMFTNAFGGGQERGLRSGTEAAFLAAGFAAAARAACERRDAAFTHVASLKERLIAGARERIADVIIQSRDDGSPYIVSIAVPGMNNKQAVGYLSDRGIYVSRASACTNNESTVEPGTWRKKHPLSLQAAGIPLAQGKQTLRISFNPANTEADVDAFIDALASFLATR